MVYKDNSEKTFHELLSEVANDQKTTLVGATLEAFKKGDASAIKLVSQALLDSQYTEESQLEISDERFVEIACLVADHCRSNKD